MNNNYQVGIYLRLSKEDERLGESGSITNQRAILMNYIKEHNLTFIKEYIDDGVSGTTFNRVGFNQMIEDINNKKINMILTKDTSRLGRDHIEFGYYVEKYFPEHNVRYIAVCDNIDTLYNNDMLLFKSAYNDMYVKDISNKIRASLNIKKRNGEFVGAYAPYGYKKDIHNKHKLIIDKETSFTVKRIFKLFIEGNSITKIANILTNDKVPIPSIQKNMNRGLKSSLFGIWTTRTITDILTNPTYQGNLTQGRSKKINYKSKKRIHTPKESWIITKNTCPAIIDTNTFEYAQTIYHSNKNRHSNKKNQDLLLKGFVYCQECNHTIGFRTIVSNTKKEGLKKNIYGNCNYYLKKRQYNGCTPHSIHYHELENIILKQVELLSSKIQKDNILKILKKKLALENKDNEIEKERNKLKANLKLEQIKLNNLYEDKISGFITTDRYLEIEKNIQNKINIIEKQLNKLSLEDNLFTQISYEDYFEKIFSKYLTSKYFLITIIDKILINEEGEINIYFKISSNDNL